MTRRWLQQLLGDTPSQAFFDKFVGLHWLHGKAGIQPRPLDDLVTLRDVELLLFDGDRRDSILLAVGGPATPPGGNDTPNHRCSAAEAVDEWAAGKTLIFNGIDAQLPAVHALARGLEGELKCRVGCNLYLTPAHGHGLKTHYDPHDVFVLQLAGSKQWRVGASAADSPMPFQMHDKVFPPIAGEHSEILLKPGDVLYIPRGALHDAVAGDELSCHLTIGLHPKTYLDAILAAVTFAADHDPQFRKYLPLGSFAIDDDAVAEARRLMSLVSQESFREVQEAFRELLASQRRRAPMGLLGLYGKSGQLSENDRFRAVPHLICSVSRTAGGIELRAMGKTMVLPLSSANDVELCCSGTVFRLSDLRGQSSREASMDFVRRLVFEGLVQRLAPQDDPGDVPVDVVKDALSSARAQYLMELAKYSWHGE